MSESLDTFLPVIVYYSLGLILRKSQIAPSASGEFLLKLVFFVSLPALILLSLPQAHFNSDSLLLPFTNILIDVGCLLFAIVYARKRGLKGTDKGSFVLCAMITNNAFAFPFILHFLGESFLVKALLFDFGNALAMSTLAYMLALRYSDQPRHQFTMLLKVFRSPIMISLAAGIALSLAGLSLPMLATKILTPLADMTGPLIFIGLGILSSLAKMTPDLVVPGVVIRMFGGLTMGILLSWLFSFERDTAIVAIICAATPVGFTALSLSSIARLNTALVANLISLSVICGLLTTPILLLFLT